MQTMKEWRDTAVEKYKDVPLERMAHREFFRNPCRAQRIDSSKFFSPADGVIIGQSRVDPDGDVVEAKGVDVTVNDLIKPWKIDVPCLCINIFMTFYDVHWNRMPTGGMVTRQPVEAIRTQNLPMLWEEQGIVKKGRVSEKDMRYMVGNARMLNRVWSTRLGYTYYMVQLADSDVSAIMPVDQRKSAPLIQSERFSFVCWGSQVALILPLDPRYRFKPLLSVTDHVEAGLDALVGITPKKKSVSA